MKVQVINKSQWELPKYETLFSAGMDVRGDFSRIKLVDGKPEKFFFDADVVGIGLMEDPNSKGVVDKEGNYTGEKLPTIQVAKTIEIKPGGRCLIPTGLFVAIPHAHVVDHNPIDLLQGRAGPGPGVHGEEVRLHIVRHLHALSRKAPAGPQPDGGAHSGKDQQQA